MGADREHLLNAIEAGDIFFAVSSRGGPGIMIAYRTDEKTIFARFVTHQTKVDFTRDGRSISVQGDERYEIFSVAPLPVAQYAIVRGLDRKLRLSHSLDQSSPDDDEKDALLNAVKLFRQWPLPKG